MCVPQGPSTQPGAGSEIGGFVGGGGAVFFGMHELDGPV
jgi:hypothetical protein